MADGALVARVLAGKPSAADWPYRVSWRREGYPAALTRTFRDRLSAEVWFQQVLRDRSKGVLMDLRLQELMATGWEERSSGRAGRRQRHEARRRMLG
jgi:hypothetical protein